MKRTVVLISALAGVMLLLAEQTNVVVSVIFENLNPNGKTRRFQPPRCLMKCGDRIDSFTYCGTEELTKRILQNFPIGQSIKLSILGYSASSDVAKIFAALNIKNLFAYTGRLEPELWSPSNALRGGALDRLVFLAFSEARAIHRSREFTISRSFQSNSCVQAGKLSKVVFTDSFPGDLCISNIVHGNLMAIETDHNMFIPDLDCLLIYSITEPRKILAACHFVGGAAFPFEGIGRALSPELQAVINERFIKIDFEKRLKREFGGQYDNLSGDALVESICNSPNKDRALEMLHSEIAHTSLGELDYLGCIPAMILPAPFSAPEVCSCDVFSTSDRKVLFVTYKESALCVWIVFDDAFWAL